MKKLYLLLVAIAILMLNSCVEKFENDKIVEKIENKIAIQQDVDVIFNGDYLQFKSLEVFDSICRVLFEMEYEEYQKWENELGFKSAKHGRKNSLKN